MARRVYLQPGDTFVVRDPNGHSILYGDEYVRKTIDRLSSRYGVDELEVSDTITIGLDEEGPYYEMSA